MTREVKIIRALRELTGRTRFRADRRGLLILQVEYKEAYAPPFWRDARTQDLAQLHHLHFSQIQVLLPDVPMPAPGKPEGASGTGKPH